MPGKGCGSATQLRVVTLRPVAAHKGGLNRLRSRLGITGIRNAAGDPEGIGAVKGRLEPRAVAVAGGKILARFVLQRRRRQDIGVDVLGVLELHSTWRSTLSPSRTLIALLSAVRLMEMSMAFATSSKAGSA